MASDHLALLAAVDDRLREEFTERCARLPGAVAQLTPLVDQVVEFATGGKRLRSRLVLLGAGERAGGAVTTAAAFDLLHAAFVLHDDVIDRDELRRGRPTIHHAGAAEYARQGWSGASAVHRGYARSIIGGDLALTTAYGMIHRAAAGLDQPTGHRLERLFDATVLATTAGELMDIELSLPPLPPHEGLPRAASASTAIDVAALKTAWYTVAAPLAAGGVVGGLPQHSTDQLHRIGMALGTAFQLQDDLLGTFGDSDRTGKPTWGDLREGKPTYLLATALAGTRHESIRELLSRLADVEDEARARADFEALRALICDSGAVDATRQKIAHLTAETAVLIEGADLPDALRDALTHMQTELTERES